MSRPSAAALESAAAQLSQQLNWVGRTSRGRLRAAHIQMVMDHHRRRSTDPAVLVSACVLWLATGGDRAPDPVNQLWHAVDLVGDQVKSRYYDISETVEQ